MANPKHIKWLLEGVDAWNARRERGGFKPNFEDADIYATFRNATNFGSGEWFPLAGVNLSGADLRGAILTWSDLTEAKFVNADLRGADLSMSILKDANLINAKSEQAKLYNSDLTNANLANTEPWKAVLYPPPDEGTRTLVPASSLASCIKSVGDLITECNKLQKHNAEYSFEETLLYFRGESNKLWQLSPPVLRKSQGKRPFWAREEEMLVNLMSRQPEAFNSQNSAIAHWVLAQHYGLKTRLIDITRNPAVALFYACGGYEGNDRKTIDGRLHIFAVPKSLVKPFNSDTVSVVANFARLSWVEKELLLGARVGLADVLDYRRSMRRLYHFIRHEKPYFEERINPIEFFGVFVVEPQRLFERIRVQSGAFLISAFHEHFERYAILRRNSGIPVYGHYTFEVPRAKKQDILNELRMLNITRETLFPGLDEAAKAITQTHSNKQL